MAQNYEGTPVSQVLIAAGGHGTRMGREIGNASCKSMLEYRGQTMLGWLLDSLLENNFDDYLISTNNHCIDDISAVLAEKRIRNPNIKIDADEGFRRIPQHFRDEMDERFLFVCGHHPVASAHIGAMLVKAETNPIVMTAYDNGLYTMDNAHRFILEGEADRRTELREVYLSESEMADTFTYVRNPYIVDAAIAQQAEDDDYRHVFSTYVFRDWQQGRGVGIVKADFAPEFDYPEEYAHIKRYIDRQLGE